MATIPTTQKILTSSADVDTTYGGPASLKEMNAWYTMQDIVDTVNLDNGLSTDELAAINDANAPTAENPFATIADLGGGSSYNVYTALTTTSPFAVSTTILENTIGAIDWQVTDVYDATGTLTGAFVANKTWISATANTASGNTTIISAVWVDANSVRIRAYSAAGAPVALASTPIEIRVYN